MRFGPLLALVILIGISPLSAAWAQDRTEYKMSLVVGPRGPWGQGAQRFIDTVGARSGGKIAIRKKRPGV